MSKPALDDFSPCNYWKTEILRAIIVNCALNSSEHTDGQHPQLRCYLE